MRKNENIIWFLPIIFLIIIFSMIGMCTPRINKKYKITKIEKENIKKFVKIDGKIEAKNIVKIGIDTDLEVDKIFFKKGDKVKKGDLIIKFSDYKEKKISGKSDELREELAVKMSRLRQNQREYEKGVDNLIKRQELVAEIKVLTEEIKKIEKEKSLIRRNIFSPINGYVMEINAIEGKNGKSDKIVVLVPENDFKIVSEPVKIKDEIGYASKVEIVKNEKNVVNGKILKIETLKNENLEMKKFEIGIENSEKESKENFILGEKINLKIIISEKEKVLTVPISAIIEKNEKKYIYLIDKNDKITEKEVKTDVNNGEKVEIKGKNLIEKMEIVENPDNEIKNNIIVKRFSIIDEKLEIKKKIEKLERENEKKGKEIEENEVELIKLKKKNKNYIDN